MKAVLPYWPAATAAHALLCEFLEHKVHVLRSVLRALVGVATLLNVYLSDRFHNLDQRTKSARLTPEQRQAYEIFWVGLDFLGISFVLSCLYALWSCHYGWKPGLGALTIFSFGTTVVVAVGAFLYIRYVSRIGELIIKAAIGVQYFFVGPCMCYILMRMPAVAIWCTYLPGLAAYILGKPADGPIWGYHDVFHAFVLLGHFMSAALGAINVKWSFSSDLDHPHQQ